jgi:hypothetical protein
MVVQEQDSATQSAFSAMNITNRKDPKRKQQAIRPVTHDCRPGDAQMILPDGRCADKGGYLQQTLVTGFKRKREQTSEDRATRTYNHLLQSEWQKLSNMSEVERMQLGRYLTIGSSQTLIDFSDQLRVARDTKNNPGEPTWFPSSISETFDMICRLDSEEATCLLLKRYHAIKLLEEEKEHYSIHNEGILIETPETMSTGGPTQMGNPAVIREAALIDRQTSKIRPDAQLGSKEFLAICRKVKRIRQLAKRLQRLTDLYGMGILALLPSGPSFSGFSLTDTM